jgi:membrane carboxypeptidase/penicillin-binding protein
VASRVEQTLSKAEILELYLNSVYLGRGAWGIELAARGYFGKPANELTLEEGALLAGLTKGPNFFSPDRHPGRAQERLAYVLSRLQEDGVIAAEQSGRGLPALPALVPYERPRRDTGFHFVDQVAREAKSIAGIEAITANSYTVRSTISPQLQRAVEGALQEGLSRYERSTGRAQFRGENSIIPRLRVNDLAGGIGRGVDDIIQAVSVDSEEWKARAKQRPDDEPSLLDVLALLFFLFILFMIVRSVASRGRGYAQTGAGPRRGSRGPIFIPIPGSWGSSGSSWSGGFPGGGGFSGGGGSFGGGGASGSW